MISIDTERLTLRDYEVADWPAVHRYAADPLVVRHMWWGPNSEADTRRFILGAIANGNRRPRTDFEFAVTLRAAGTLIGGCSLNARNRPEYATAEIGYCFAAEVWGRGYGSEAVAALCQFGFREARLHRIFALIDPQNVASNRLVERVDFRREGHLRNDTLIRGEWRDSLVYALLAEEWERRTDG
jgi:RimJ/RimL family protein N-acetyltransferase